VTNTRGPGSSANQDRAEVRDRDLVHVLIGFDPPAASVNAVRGIPTGFRARLRVADCERDGGNGAGDRGKDERDGDLPTSLSGARLLDQCLGLLLLLRLTVGTIAAKRNKTGLSQ
jgi:hypothetical protein